MFRRFFFIILASIPLFSVSQSLLLEDKLAAFFPFDGSFDDKSGKSHQVTVGEVSLDMDRFGRPDSSASFTGSNGSYIQVDGLLNDYSLATISIWAKWTGETTFHPSQVLFNKPRTEGGTGLSLSLHTESLNIGTTLAPTSGEPATGVFLDQLPVPGEWHHYVIVHDSEGLHFYIDGDKLDHTGYSRFDFLSQIPFEIGRLSAVPACCGNLSTWNFSGQLDDFRVYERAMSEAEVKFLHELESTNSSSVRRTATAVPQVVNGFVVGVEVFEGGYGYTFPPTVTITGGGGSGAEAVAVVSAGIVSAVQVINPGSGYTSVPTVIIEQPPVPLTRAVATAQVVNGFIVGINLIDPGYGYTDPPQITIHSAEGSGAQVVALIEGERVVGFNIISTGSGYPEDVIVQIAPPPFAPKLSIRVTQVEVNLQLVEGKRYILESSNNMSDWMPVGDVFTAEGEFVAMKFEVDEVGEFFRVIEQP